MANDIYNRSLTGAQFRPLCGGNQQQDGMESCVEVAEVPGEPDLIAVRDGKHPEREPLRFTRSDLAAAGLQV
ncbi:DUF397 domain-containing protein [Nonomuraea harbinensis]|uniref:DUF397 domain-containing protein n=1 Tax=Nonomuraea harbinensis TaxID=1286938 RepID=A0ABW1C5U1_9ACTN|nr:DUF397 domain-containing protein [Nonomuraea harbinensis]